MYDVEIVGGNVIIRFSFLYHFIKDSILPAFKLAAAVHAHIFVDLYSKQSSHKYLPPLADCTKYGFCPLTLFTM